MITVSTEDIVRTGKRLKRGVVLANKRLNDATIGTAVGSYNAVRSAGITASHVARRPFFDARRSWRRASTHNPFTHIVNSLRMKGIVTEGFDPDRDCYVRRVNLGNISFDYVLKRFHVGHIGVSDQYPTVKPPRYSLVKPGMQKRYFGSVKDLFEGQKEILFSDDYFVAPRSPFILHDREKGKYFLVDPQRFELRRSMRQPCFPG